MLASAASLAVRKISTERDLSVRLYTWLQYKCGPAVAVAILAGSPYFLALMGFAQASDISDEERAFHACLVCHSTKQATQRTGPSLFGIVGRKAGTEPGYNRYSKAMLESNITWSPELLDKWIEDPRALMPRTRMLFSGLRDPVERQLIVDFLQRLNVQATETPQ